MYVRLCVSTRLVVIWTMKHIALGILLSSSPSIFPSALIFYFYHTLSHSQSFIVIIKLYVVFAGSVWITVTFVFFPLTADVYFLIVSYPVCFLRMAAPDQETVWETESTFLAQWCFMPKIRNVQSNHRNNVIVQYSSCHAYMVYSTPGGKTSSSCCLYGVLHSRGKEEL